MEKPELEVSKVEYRVRKIERYVVTRYHEIGGGIGAGVDTKGEYGNAGTAREVAYALCKAEHDSLGWPIGDERIQYPRWDEAVANA